MVHLIWLNLWNVRELMLDFQKIWEQTTLIYSEVVFPPLKHTYLKEKYFKTIFRMPLKIRKRSSIILTGCFTKGSWHRRNFTISFFPFTSRGVQKGTGVNQILLLIFICPLTKSHIWLIKPLETLICQLRIFSTLSV